MFVSKGLLLEEAGEGTGAGAGTGENKSGNQFDSAAFKTELLGEFDKKLNGALKSHKADFAKTIKDALAAQTQQKETDSAKDEAKSGEGKPDPEKNALALELKKYKETSESRILALEARNKEIETKAEADDRKSRLRTALSAHPIATGAMDYVVEAIFPLVSRSEDDQSVLIAKDLPLAKYLEVTLPVQYPFFLANKEIGGAGARNGKAAGSQKKYDMDRKSAGYALAPANFQKFSVAEQGEIRQLAATS